MTRVFIELPSFVNDWRDLGLCDVDLRRLQSEILSNPNVGKVIRDTGGIRKMRFAFVNRGKRGSVRVIYVDFELKKKIFLITAYSKTNKDNLTKAERNDLKRLVSVLEKQCN